MTSLGATSLGTLAQALVSNAQAGAQPLSAMIAGYFAAPDFGGPPAVQAAAGAADLPNGYQVQDYVDRFYPTDAAASGGLLTVTVPQVPASQLWLVDRMMVFTTSSDDTEAFVYVGSQIAPQTLRAGTESGNLDFAQDTSGLFIPGTLQMFVRWEGADDGSIGGVGMQYRVLG